LHTQSHRIAGQCFHLEIIPKCKDITDTVNICGFSYTCVFLVCATKQVATWVCDLGTLTSICFCLKVSKKASHTGDYSFLAGRGNYYLTEFLVSVLS